MKITLKSEFVYNGMFVKESPCEPREVELLGVPVPVDPGIVKIKDGDKERYAPTCVLEGCPKIDFDVLMTAQQKANRGILLGNGVGGFTDLIPISEVPLVK